MAELPPRARGRLAESRIKVSRVPRPLVIWALPGVVIGTSNGWNGRILFASRHPDRLEATRQRRVPRLDTLPVEVQLRPTNDFDPTSADRRA